MDRLEELTRDLKKALLICGVLFATAPLSALFYAWTIATLWAWFVAPAFQVPQISVPVAYGLTLLVAVLRMKPGELKEKKERTTKRLTWSMAAYAILPRFVQCGVALVLAAIVRMFV